MTELARNVCPEPLFIDRTGESVSWTDGFSNAVSIGGLDSWGELAPGLHVYVGSGNGTGVAVPLPLTPGQAYRVTLDLNPTEYIGTTAVYWGASFTAGHNPVPKTDESVSLWGNIWQSSNPLILSGTIVAEDGDTHLRVRSTSTNAPTHYITAVRVSPVDPGATDFPDDLGIFDGYTPSTDTVTYAWEGDPYASESVATAPVEPDPEPEPMDLSGRVAAYLNRPGDPETIALARAQLPVVTAYVYGYTRGRGFGEDGTPKLDLQHVIVAATAFLTSNPEQVTYYAAGDYSERPAVLAGWTLPQLAILHRYRRRYA